MNREGCAIILAVMISSSVSPMLVFSKKKSSEVLFMNHG